VKPIALSIPHFRIQASQLLLGESKNDDFQFLILGYRNCYVTTRTISKLSIPHFRILCL